MGRDCSCPRKIGSDDIAEPGGGALDRQASHRVFAAGNSFFLFPLLCGCAVLFVAVCPAVRCETRARSARPAVAGGEYLTERAAPRGRVGRGRSSGRTRGIAARRAVSGTQDTAGVHVPHEHTPTQRPTVWSLGANRSGPLPVRFAPCRPLASRLCHCHLIAVIQRLPNPPKKTSN